jgi:STE24 endopeptidase
LAVLAHEIGHYKHKHTLKGMLNSILQTGLILFIFSLLIDNPILNQALGSEHQTFHFGLLVFGFLMEPISLLTGILTNVFSRKNEFQADAFAKKQGLSEHLINGLKQLSRKNLSNLTPHPFYIFVHYSHPSLSQRMNALE